MKKVWIAYNGITVLILAALIVLDYFVNVVQNGDDINRDFMGFSIYLCEFNILIAMPIWLIVLLMNRSRMNRKSFLIGLVLFLMFLGMTAYPVISAIGYMGS